MSRRPIDAAIEAGGARGEETVQDEVREAFARWTSGVTVVAVRDATRVHGLTVSAFTPLSLHPPLVLLALAGDAPVLSYLEDVRRFVVNVLASDQRGLAGRFSDRFPIAPGIFPAHGDPLLPGALAAFVCDVEAIHPGGDHRIVIGRVARAVSNAGAPLVYQARGYRSLTDEPPR